ncbi:hypothetical protein [Pedobacter arcticus]|uniref:hypothetical protein n=1 Tax=Pedobacter arcticus TaxID=752140 RepID=UPI0003117F2C|nr:hypothetical protein [Pedobacter arcticus]
MKYIIQPIAMGIFFILKFILVLVLLSIYVMIGMISFLWNFTWESEEWNLKDNFLGLDTVRSGETQTYYKTPIDFLFDKRSYKIKE